MTFGLVALWCSGGLIVAVLLSALVVAVRVAREGAERAVPAGRSWQVAVGAFALVCGSSAMVVDRFAVHHPYWDQWIEADMYLQFIGGKLTWSDLFAAHHEHRIVLSRLWALMLFLIDRQWDNRVQAAANTLLHALPAGMLVGLLAQRLKGRELVFAATALVIPWAIPMGRENVVWGFESRFYFLLIVAPLALWLLTRHKPLSLGFWLGACVGALTLFCMGSGPLCPLALLLTAGIEAARIRSSRRDLLPVLVVGLILTAVGLSTRVAFAPNEAQHARSIGEYLRTALRTAAFPFIHRPSLALLMWAPALLWFGRLVRRSVAWTGDQRFLAALGAFVLLHAPAVGYARGLGGQEPASRYCDILAMALLVNTLALVALMRESRARWRVVPVIAWAALAAWGVTARGVQTVVEELPLFCHLQGEQEQRVRRYLHTRDPSQLVAQQGWELPYLRRDSLKTWLDDPRIASFLPATLREADTRSSGRPSGQTVDLSLLGKALTLVGVLLWLLALGGRIKEMYRAAIIAGNSTTLK